MSSPLEFVQTIKALLNPMGEVEGKQIFGGVGLSVAAKQFAIIRGTTVFFRVNDTTRPKYQEKGMLPFSYASSKGIVKVKQYYAVPDELLKYPELLVKWASEAVNVVHQG